MPTVIVTEGLDQVCADWLAVRVDLIACNHEQTDEFHRRLAEADGLVVRTYTQVNTDLIERAPRLKVVGRAGVGLENIDVEACGRRGVQVVYTPDANTQSVVDYVIGLILDDQRPRYTLTDHVDAGTFHRLRREKVGTQLDQLTMGVLGFGRIGKRLGRVAHALGMKLLVNDLLPEADLRMTVDYPFRFVDKPTLYQESDVLTIHVDGRPENRHLIDAPALQRLKPNCLLINAARGMLIDSAALADWAQRAASSGGRAVLDVHDPEPPPADYPLYGLTNVRLLPHLAARTHTGLENMCWVVRDVAAVLDRKQPQYPAACR